MSALAASRREVMTSLALGAGVLAAAIAPTTAAAGEHSEPERALRAVDRRRLYRQLHRERLSKGNEDFSAYSPLSPDGIKIALDGLTEEHVINGDDRDILDLITDHLFDTNIEEADSLFERIEHSITSFFNDASKVITDVGETIVAIVEDSADYAKEAFHDVDLETVRIAIAHDMQGAIQGAGAGASAGAVFGHPVPGAVIGALGGGASGSVIGYYRDRG